MRLSDLLKMEVSDNTQKAIGQVRDVRLERDGDEWEVTALIVGPGAVAGRLGFLYGAVEKPVLVARLMRWIGRHARVVPWSLVRFEGERIVLDRNKNELSRLGEER